MIFGRHVRHRISAWADGELGQAEAARVDAHLARCAACREVADQYRAVATLLRKATPAEAPANIWASIESALDERASGGDRSKQRGRFTSWWMPAAAAAGVALLVVFWWSRPEQFSWDVVRIDQAREARVPAGQWIETDSGSTAAIRVGQIGRVDIASGTRLQLLTASSREHRLNLAEGRISVEIVAPPRVFFVNTPASTVVDLGCAYTMDVAPDGSGTLRVTQGWASLEWAERESLVPAGASAITRPGLPPGTPAFDDASERLREALVRFDYGVGGFEALMVVLAEARPRDTLTLWHLMARVGESERARVFERLVSLTPLPAGVDRNRALALDANTMRHWREELAWTW